MATGTTHLRTSKVRGVTPPRARKNQKTKAGRVPTAVFALAVLTTGCGYAVWVWHTLPADHQWFSGKSASSSKSYGAWIGKAAKTRKVPKN